MDSQFKEAGRYDRAAIMTEMHELKRWVGRSETVSEEIAAFPARALAATLDRDDPPYGPGSALPPLWHWMHFLAVSPLREAGSDGHPRRGGFLPPVPLPQRMWAGSRLEFHRPLRIGESARRTSTIKSIEHKSGRSGDLVFVTVHHAFDGPDGPAISEEHDIVYRAAPAPGTPQPPPLQARTDMTWRRIVHPDPVLLFRYSALTFNSHRIHYDHPYVTGQEGYSGLVVHGPLIATLLLDLVRREQPQATVRSFSFRAVSPLICDVPFEVRGAAVGKGVDLQAVGSEGRLAMEGRAVVA
jgi:3-methylfumaryl-CoA hydratase